MKEFLLVFLGYAVVASNAVRNDMLLSCLHTRVFIQPSVSIILARKLKYTSREERSRIVQQFTEYTGVTAKFKLRQCWGMTHRHQIDPAMMPVQCAISPLGAGTGSQ